MTRLTYAQVCSAASALIKERNGFHNGKKIQILIYKDSGGEFNKRILRNDTTICYTSIKAIMWMNDKKEIVKVISREAISSILEDYKINFIFCKFG